MRAAQGSAGVEVGLLRGVIAQQIVVSTPADPFMSLRALVAYSGLSRRTLMDLLYYPVRPLPHYRVGRKILVRRSEFDAWMAASRQVGRADVDAIVSDVLRKL